MLPLFPLAPRYRLDDELPWLEGIDPLRHYWIRLNGSEEVIAIPGLVVDTFEDFKQKIRAFRALQPGDCLSLSQFSASYLIRCISQNCYAIEASVHGAAVWHLFDQETLESLLMTGHPDWQCATKDLELGRRLLIRSWSQSTAA